MLSIQLVDIQNVVISLFILFATYRAYQQYQLTKAKGLLILFLGGIYLIAYRVFLVFVTPSDVWRNWLVLPFYIALAISMDTTLRLLRIYIHEKNNRNWFTRIFKGK